MTRQSHWASEAERSKSTKLWSVSTARDPYRWFSREILAFFHYCLIYSWPQLTNKGHLLSHYVVDWSTCQVFQQLFIRAQKYTKPSEDTVHKRALFWSLHSSEEKHINLLPKLQSSAYLFQNVYLPVSPLPDHNTSTSSSLWMVDSQFYWR